jgi:excisionase family DNA binding protein
MRVSRVQQVEKVVRARDEDDAIARIGVELEKPYGMIANWTTVATEVEVLSAETTLTGTPVAPDGGPLLLSIKDAARHLGISYGTLYEFMNRGEIEYVHIGRRRLVTRDALAKFITTNTRTGYHPYGSE